MDIVSREKMEMRLRTTWVGLASGLLFYLFAIHATDALMAMMTSLFFGSYVVAVYWHDE